MQTTRTKKELLVDTFGWGFVLWVIGFALGMMLFPFVPVAYLGFVIVPIIILITIAVAYIRLRGSNQPRLYYAVVGLVWLLYPLVLDYVFLVRAFSVENYYDTDLFIYYIAMFVIPLAIGIQYGKSSEEESRTAHTDDVQ